MTQEVPGPDDIMEDRENVSEDMAGPTEGALPAGLAQSLEVIVEEAVEISPFALYDKEVYEKDFRGKPQAEIIRVAVPAELIPDLTDDDVPLTEEEEEEIGASPKDSSALVSAASSQSSALSDKTPTETTSTNASSAAQETPANAAKGSGRPKASDKSSTPTSSPET